MKKFISKLKNKLDIAKSESDFTYFFSLLVTGEAIAKISTLTTAAALNIDEDRHQYRILHGLVRASGIGEWSKAIDDMLIGTASHHLKTEFRPYQTQMTTKCNDSDWQFKAVSSICNAMKAIQIDVDESRGKKDLKSWFKYFTELRNKTRGHGATGIEKASLAAGFLEESINIIIENLDLLTIPVAHLKRNLSGKYRVTEVVECGGVFDMLKKSDDYQYDDGLYLYLGGFVKIPLMISDADLDDFFISNGGFTTSKYELLSYCTDDKKVGDSSEYLMPKGQLPPSESEGLGELKAYDNCFSNVPVLSYEYISRIDLEDQLFNLLEDDRRTVVTLLGRGGIGKTSLALRVIPRLYEITRFDAIIWFSSRDIDLQSNGVKIVNPDVISDKDIAKYFSTLFLSVKKFKEKGFDSIKYFQTQLTKSEIGPCLFVFDNFETTDNPVEVFKWIDTYIRNPNKILITTRLRDFKGDYPLNVHGMTFDESKELIFLTAKKLDIDKYLTNNMIDEIYKVSGGHPYIMKVLLGDLSKNNMKASLPKIIAGSDEVLTALFERTYSALNPCAQRVFLTLASWRSVVPRLGLEAVLMVSIGDPLEVEKSIDRLLQYSMAEESKSSKDSQYYIGLPYVAMAFGVKKLSVSPLKSTIMKDVRILQKFGPSKLEDKNLSLERNLSKFLSGINQTEDEYEKNKEILERICRTFNDGWLVVARWLLESSDQKMLSEAKNILMLYLENEKSSKKRVIAWNKLAEVSRILMNPIEEVHALVEASQYFEVEFYELSNIANKINRMFNTNELVLDDHDVKVDLLIKLFDVMYRRKKEADSTDCSRMSWLALHLNKPDIAKELVSNGLDLDSQNRYCQKLKDKIENYNH